MHRRVPTSPLATLCFAAGASDVAMHQATTAGRYVTYNHCGVVQNRPLHTAHSSAHSRVRGFRGSAIPGVHSRRVPAAADWLRTRGHAARCVQGNCTSVPNTVAATAEPLAPLTASQCVITATASVLVLPPLSHRVWLDSLYLRLESPPAAAVAADSGGGPLVATGVSVPDGDAGAGGGVSLWITNFTVQGGGNAATRGLLVEHPQATVHVEGVLHA